MIITTKCHSCNYLNKSEADVGWIKTGSIPVTCRACGSAYLAKATIDTEDSEISKERSKPQHDPQTNLDVLTNIEINNAEHPLHGESGTIVDKDDLYYRIKMDKNGDLIWIPHHWVILKKTT